MAKREKRINKSKNKKVDLDSREWDIFIDNDNLVSMDGYNKEHRRYGVRFYNQNTNELGVFKIKKKTPSRRDVIELNDTTPTIIVKSGAENKIYTETNRKGKKRSLKMSDISNYKSRGKIKKSDRSKIDHNLFSRKKNPNRKSNRQKRNKLKK